MMTEAMFRSGYRRDHHDRRDLFKLTPPVAVPVRAEVSNKPEIRDQGHLNACTGFSIAWFWQQVLASRGLSVGELSALFPYWFARLDDGSPTSEDAGASLRGVIAGLAEHGTPPADRWPDWMPAAEQPNAACDPYARAVALGSVGKYLRCDSLEDIKHAVAVEDQSVVLGLMVYREWFQVGPDGVIRMPDPWRTAPVGGHAIACCGYDDGTGLLTLANSWGRSNGRQGYYYLPYGYLDVDAWDCWTVGWESIPDARTGN